jgi:hypothetical protein
MCFLTLRFNHNHLDNAKGQKKAFMGTVCHFQSIASPQSTTVKLFKADSNGRQREREGRTIISFLQDLFSAFELRHVIRVLRVRD